MNHLRDKPASDFFSSLLILSMVAALQAPVILMSQNRQASRDRLAAALDYEINLKAEVEIMALHDKLDRLRTDRIEAMIGAQTVQIAAMDTDLRALLADRSGSRGDDAVRRTETGR
ncbi:DUF1003 domain-containing protein [Methylobacterium sp. Leaf106]|uniref:DUF1003 domain-containing protein n=1 Tax=Methylobacterium sp. Leaf106 TaxID=1736255 RepID=UPI003FCC58B5